MNLKYIDIHSHLQFPQFDSDREAVIAKMKEEGIGAIVVGTDFESSKKAVALAERHDNLWASIGLHPNDNTNENFDFALYKKLAAHKKVVAIGECGLDYFRMNTDAGDGEKRRQKELFKIQIKLAVESNLPLMIHVRDAYEDILHILAEKKKEYGEKLRGNIHFFAGDLSTAKGFWALGFSTSFTGVITFADSYDEVVKNAPADKIMSETDCPYVAPVPHRGGRCEPCYVKEVAQKIAEIQGEDIEIIRVRFMDNFNGLFF